MENQISHIENERSIGYKILQWLFFPTVLFGGLVGALTLSKTLPPSYLPIIPLGLVFIFLIVVFLFERYLPYKKEWNISTGDTLADVLHTFLVLPISSKLTEIGLFVILVLPSAKLNELIGFSNWAMDLPVLLQLAIVLVIAEFFFYWYHRFFHINSHLWKLHSVHHAGERLYAINSGRFHILENMIGTLFYFSPLILLQVPDQVIMLFLVVNLMSGFLEHVNIDYKTGPLNYIFNTAELHRWHHSIIVEQSNNNFGKVLVIWDLIFGTRYLPKNEEVGKLGVDSPMELPKDIIGQMKYPFIVED